MKDYVYFSPQYGGHYCIFTTWGGGVFSAEIAGKSGPVTGVPETWNGGWEFICVL